MSSEVVIPALLEHQAPIAAHPARYKVVRAPRRWGKTRFAFHVATLGHGPGQCYKGLVHGFDVAWIAPDYPQSLLIWSEEVFPRFKGVEGVRVNASEHTVSIPGGGTLWLRSAESIDGIRGIGARLGGVVCDEAAWMDLEYALRKVIMAALMDNQGWLILLSTPNAGLDGNMMKETPSYFNRLCKQVMAGERGPEWAHFHGKIHDNPKLSPDAIAALIAEYPKDSYDLKQEVYAELLEAGAGLAFPEFLPTLHVCPTRTPPRSWAYFGAMDWGYRQGSFGLYACSPDGDLEKVMEFVDGFSGLHAKDAALEITRRIKEFPQPEYIEADEQMWQVMGTGMTLAEEFLDGLALAYGGGHYAPQFRAGRHSAGSRAAKKNLVHRYLDYGAPGSVHRPDPASIKPWERPKFTVQERCVQTIKMFQTIPLDPKKPDDVDTTHPTDHQYDETAFALASRPPLGERVHAPADQEHRDAGLDYEGKRVKDWQQDYGSEQMRRGGLHTMPTHTRITKFRVQGD